MIRRGRWGVSWGPGEHVLRGSHVHEESHRSKEQKTEALLTEQAVKSDHGVRTAVEPLLIYYVLWITREEIREGV